MRNHKTSDEDLQKLLEMLETRARREESLAWDDIVLAAEQTVGRKYTRQGLHKLRLFGERLEKLKKLERKIVSDEAKENNYTKSRLKEMLKVNEELIGALIDLGRKSPICPERLAQMAQKIQRQRIDG